MKKILSITLVTGLISISAYGVTEKKTYQVRESSGGTKTITQQRMEDGGRTSDVRTNKKTYIPADNTVKKTQSTSEATEDMNDVDDY